MGYNGANNFVTGVAFTDAAVADNFYTVGEGVGGIHARALASDGGGGFGFTTTLAAGGYAVQVPNGAYDISAYGTGLDGVVTVGHLVVNGANVKVDILDR